MAPVQGQEIVTVVMTTEVCDVIALGTPLKVVLPIYFVASYFGYSFRY